MNKFGHRRFRSMMATVILVSAVLGVVGTPGIARGQQSTQSPSAAQPSTGVFLVRNMWKYRLYEDNRPRGEYTADHITNETIVSFGVNAKLAAMVHVPLIYRNVEEPGGKDNDDFGINDIPVMLKYRIWQDDIGPIDTSRLSLIGGLEIPTFDAGFSSDSFDPFIGVTTLNIRGRHGLNASARWKFNTGERADPFVGGDDEDDALFYDLAYLYRITPASYTADTEGAWYFQTEINGLYETNGDHEILLSPGLMYEARNWVFEVGVQLPVYQELDERPELEFSIVAGLRILF